jgi:hypothetical protein
LSGLTLLWCTAAPKILLLTRSSMSGTVVAAAHHALNAPAPTPW